MVNVYRKTDLTHVALWRPCPLRNFFFKSLIFMYIIQYSITNSLIIKRALYLKNVRKKMSLLLSLTYRQAWYIIVETNTPWRRLDKSLRRQLCRCGYRYCTVETDRSLQRCRRDAAETETWRHIHRHGEWRVAVENMSSGRTMWLWTRCHR